MAVVDVELHSVWGAKVDEFDTHKKVERNTVYVHFNWKTYNKKS